MAEFSNGNGLRDHMLILARFLRNPRTVGTLWPSSEALASEMVTEIPQDTDATVVELGPGTGALTGAIVDRLGPSARFLAVDLEPAFVESIRQRWPAVECVCASAEHLEALLAVRNLGPIDHVISGLPFASLPGAMTRRILEGVAKTLRPGGTFTTFQYLHGYRLPTARSFRNQMNEHMGGAPKRHAVMRNFPPAYVLTWTRRSN
jgi:phosphatidylethanolamine/phosphatidyl-N-methylethanolamine N-methyltransferase